MSNAATCLVPAGTSSVRPLRYLVRVQVVSSDRVVWLSDAMSLADAKALRRPGGATTRSRRSSG